MARDIELSLLSAILRSRDAALQAGDKLQGDALSDPAKIIYDTAMEVMRGGTRPDADTVETHLRARDQFPEDVERVFEEASSRSVAPMNVDMFIGEINSQHLEEEVKRACDEVWVQVDKGEVQGEEAQDLLEKRAMDIGLDTTGEFRHMSDVITAADEKVQEAMETEGGVIGIPSKLDRLDDLTGGFQDEKLYIIAARPSVGKSALAGTCIYNSAEEGYSNAAYLLEMAAEGFALRGASKRSRVDSFDLTTGQLSQGEYATFKGVVDEVRDLPVWMDDTPGLAVEQIYRRLRRLKMKHDIDIAWVDYMQLMEESGVGSNRDLEIGHMSRTLKLMAKELSIPIVALCQLNRNVEHRSTPKPQLADLRSSGNIEQDSDVVIFIYRPEMYGITRDEAGNSLEGIAELIVGKHRGGPTGVAKVHFSEKYATFEPLAHV